MSEQEEAQSGTYNRVPPHEAPMLLPTTAPTGLSGFPPYGSPREHHKEMSGDPTLGVQVESLSPAQEVVIAQHVLRAEGPTDVRVAGARTNDPPIIRTPMAPNLSPLRVEVAPEPATTDVAMIEDMDMDRAEDIICVSDLAASRCNAGYRRDMRRTAVAASPTLRKTKRQTND